MDHTIISKTKVDRAGLLLLQDSPVDDDMYKEANDIIDFWRQSHLKPLTELTLKIESWLHGITESTYVAHRLKRKPQILKKLRRSSTMRLSQMQDIGGCRAIFENNYLVDVAADIIRKKCRKSRLFNIIHEVDYRQNGRLNTGYRALHIIVERNEFRLEIQLRSKYQHYWAEAVERASIKGQFSLKEGEGPRDILKFFQLTSNALYSLEVGKKLLDQEVLELINTRSFIEMTIGNILEPENVLNNEQFINAMIEKERSLNTKGINNWIIIFNWKDGLFVHWVAPEKKVEEASKQYSDLEKTWPYEKGFEVVLIGANSVSTIRETHSHYFGVESYNVALELLKYALMEEEDELAN